MRQRTLPSLDEILAGLAEQGVTDAPTTGPDDETLRALLDIALYVAELKKKVHFTSHTWDDPGFDVDDARVKFRVAYAKLEGTIEETLLANLDRAGPGRLLAIDGHHTEQREFEIGHALYGQVTLFAWPYKPSESADPRIHHARENGWTPTLKEHNLLPGRGIVVLDENQGTLLRDPRFARLAGILLLLADGHIRLWWNPFADGADSELQHWKAWGNGAGPASGWKEQLYVSERED